MQRCLSLDRIKKKRERRERGQEREKREREGGGERERERLISAFGNLWFPLSVLEGIPQEEAQRINKVIFHWHLFTHSHFGSGAVSRIQSWTDVSLALLDTEGSHTQQAFCSHAQAATLRGRDPQKLRSRHRV